MDDDLFKLYKEISNKNQNDATGAKTSSSSGQLSQRSKSFNMPLTSTSTNITPSTSSLASFARTIASPQVEKFNEVNVNRGVTLIGSNPLSSQLNTGTSSMYSTSRNQTENELYTYDNNSKRRLHSKGLRHFSMKVCDKVKEKGLTTYSQVADELVYEFCSMQLKNTNTSTMNSKSRPNHIDLWTFDQKNVRRRVYDALNVLMAMNIISKDKKEIRWLGLPCNKKQECQDLEAEKKRKEERIKAKTEMLKNLLLEV